MPVYRIPVKVGTEMRLYTPLLSAKFEGNRILRSRFIAAFVSVRKEEEKTKKLSQCLKSHISGTLEIICSNLECGVLKLEGVSTAKIILFHQGTTELRR